MSDEQISPIRPKSVPLSHAQPATRTQTSKSRLTWLPWLLGGALALALIIAVFVVLPDLVEPPAVTRTATPPVTPAEQPATTPESAPLNDEQAPFATLLRAQAREKAQAELGEFVELQLQLEQSMQVGSWGQAEYDAAKALATEGDEQFLREQFDAALTSYDAAASALAELIERGRELLDEAIVAGEAALDERDRLAAESRFEFALTIDPNDARAQAGLARAAVLETIVVLMREGKNHELAGNWQAALASYEEVRQLDPLTSGLEDALASARAGVREAKIRGELSSGFAALEAGRYGAARTAFDNVLRLEPGHPIAVGGLEQVAERNDLSRIEQLRQRALEAESGERWEQAIKDYDAVLALDANIQFAKDGRARAAAQQRATESLGRIIGAPDKLSSTKLFDDAKNILARAEQLEPRGPKLAEHIAAVSDLIRIYSTTVEVTFRSDNATRITLSTVGALGAFDEKRVSLRPGAYTVIGSRSGCRDVRESILVRPDMQPVDIRCQETF